MAQPVVQPPGQSKKKKKGPPYFDDPGCKFIVIDDPWPGNKFGKDRKSDYYNVLSAWVRFMLGKKHWVEFVYSVNTRADVIVQLPEDVDIAPILGAHKWYNFLARGDQKDRHRVSYVFEYNYRDRGQPSNHGWQPHEPLLEEPPAHLRFPVKFPYPPPSWASPVGRSCQDLARHLPGTRQRTPTPPPPLPPPPPPDRSLYEPYEPPSHYSAHLPDTNPAQGVPDDDHVEQVKAEPEQPRLYVRKLDPYEEEEAALEFVKQEQVDAPLAEIPPVKQEAIEIHVKSEAPETRVPAPEPPPESRSEPSNRFLAMFERLERMNATQVATQPDIRPEPSDRVSGAVATPGARHSTGPPELQSNAAIRVKPEPEEVRLPLAPPAQERTSDPRIRDPRLAHGQAVQLKRVKQEEDEGVLKRVKTEPRD
ncbi:hypothetical protein OBBRIDRAFT_787842 [Obba rivulosa]|uniref:Uncharacterized protein n=1 Tax=Obba rivulosa TaxID=1052685 RepID=A0A8E2DUC0_9APHY|nr:hypothetical protein OBBRIDRAFT_787842 [Obba rivulosa]